MRPFLLLILLLPCAAGAQTMFKCKAADGTTAYQQRPCEGAKEVGSSYVAPVADSGPAWSGSEERPVELGAQPAGPAAPPAADSAPAEAVAYQCSAGSKQWVQEAPCPATRRGNEFVQLNGALVDGKPAHGTAVRRVDVPVEQRAVTASEVCSGAVRAADTYATNQLKRRAGC